MPNRKEAKKEFAIIKKYHRIMRKVQADYVREINKHHREMQKKYKWEKGRWKLVGGEWKYVTDEKVSGKQ